MDWYILCDCFLCRIKVFGCAKAARAVPLYEFRRMDMIPVVDLEKCDGCESCVEVCPTESITIVDGKAVVDPEECIECEACVDACPNGALTMAEEQQAGSQTQSRQDAAP